MTELPQITDHDSLEAWLKTRPRADAEIIAWRAAMRVMPLWIAAMRSDLAQRRDLTAFPIARLNLTSRAARKYPALEAAAAYAAAADDAADAMWNAVQADAHALITDADPLDAALWPDSNPLADDWARAQIILREDTPGGAFWIDWYQAALDGRPPNLPLMKAVAEIPDALWDAANTRKNPESSAALDRAISDLRRDHAIAATANGERVVQDPDSGKLQLVPDTQLPDDVAAYARRKIAKAAAIFDDEAGQQYGGLSGDLAMLRRAVADAANLPVELFDSCSAAVRRLDVRARNGDCPHWDQDPLIADYRNRLREAGADILAADPETQATLQRRAAITPNDALIEAGAAISAMVDATAPILQGRLADALPEDADAATDPDMPAEARAAPSFRLSGRVLRIVRFAQDVRTGFIAGNAALVGVATYMQALEFLVTSPVVRRAVEAIYRYLGL